MRRGLRWLVAITAAIICVASVVLWIRSYRIGGALVYRHTSSSALYYDWVALVAHGRVGFIRMRWKWPKDTPPPPFSTRKFSAYEYALGKPWPINDAIFDFAGFALTSDVDATSQTIGLSHYTAMVPFWFITAGAGVTSVIAIRRIAHRARRNPTACKTCGYDLRAGHDKCPECGGESHVPAKAVVE